MTTVFRISKVIFIFVFTTLVLSEALYSQTYNFPEMMYFRFKNNGASTTPNYALNPVGNPNATLSGANRFTTGGQFDSCMSGSGMNGGSLNTGWATNMPANWTISFWLGENQSDSGFARYIFGDSSASQFRCFYGGAATTNNLIVRGNFADVLVPGVNPQATVVHLVYTGSELLVYRNGVYYSSFARTITASGTGPFKIGGYGISNRSLGGRIDEFRMYNRALSGAEIAASWNSELPIFPTGIIQTGLVPSGYNLSQNYPNPFNPQTTISFGVPKDGFVSLEIVDNLGKIVSNPVNRTLNAGEYKMEFDGSALSSGVYFYRIIAGDFTQTRKMILSK